MGFWNFGKKEEDTEKAAEKKSSQSGNGQQGQGNGNNSNESAAALKHRLDMKVSEQAGSGESRADVIARLKQHAESSRGPVRDAYLEKIRELEG